MFKVIQLNDAFGDTPVVSTRPLSFINNSYREVKHPSLRLMSDPILAPEHFERTLAGKKGSPDILDLEKRSSWTHKHNFQIESMPAEVSHFMKQHSVLEHGVPQFNLLKYGEGDFFLNHRDTAIHPTHQFTCLLFCPYGDGDCEGGELVFKHPDGLYDITFNPAVEINNGRFVMVIFSIDMFHEVLPITKGTRWVFKRPLLVKLTAMLECTLEAAQEEDDLCDGGCGIRGDSGDY